MPDRRADQPGRTGDDQRGKEQAQQHQGGYEGAGPGYGRGYGRDFGGGGANQGFDGSWGRGYGASFAPLDYRQGMGGREETVGPNDRSWYDRCADDEASGRAHRHRGRGPKTWSRDDQRIYEDVCERLLHDRLIDARDIEVEVDNGIVTLRGEAHAAADPALAERLARETPGVRAVELDLKVRVRPRPPEPPPASADERIDKSPLGYPILPT